MDGFLGEIRMFAGDRVPAGWELCDGKLLSPLSNNALFSLLGTKYGGDGKISFGLPDLRTMNERTKGYSGGNKAHENMPPFVSVNFIICIAGIFLQ